MPRFLSSIVQYFERIAALLFDPGEALRRAGRGDWNAFRDAMILLAIAAGAIYTPDLVRVITAGIDLGIREGFQEISFSLGRRLSPDLLAGVAVAALTALPLRLAGALDTDRGLSLAAAVWIPFFAVRLVGAMLRFHGGLPPARLWEGADWWIATAWATGLALVALAQGFRGRYA